MKNYEEIKVTIIYFQLQDVITSSMSGSNGNYEGENKEPDNWG